MTEQRSQAQDIAAVQQAHERFYRALEAADLAAMESLWLHTDQVRCVHPGWEALTGWAQVRQSWAGIFQNSRGLHVMPGEAFIYLMGDVAWACCTENLVIFYEDSPSPVAAVTTATNLFRRTGNEWRMVLHHASPVPSAMPINESETLQ